MGTETSRDAFGTVASVVLGAVAGLVFAVPALSPGQELLVLGLSLNQTETVLVFGAFAIVALPGVTLLLSALIR